MTTLSFLIVAPIVLVILFRADRLLRRPYLRLIQKLELRQRAEDVIPTYPLS